MQFIIKQYIIILTAAALSTSLWSMEKENNKTPPFPTPPLSEAAARNDKDQVQKLLKSGAEVNKQDHHKKTALQCAVENGFLEIVELLISANANPNIRDVSGYTPLHLAAQKGDKSIVALLLNAKDIDINIPDTFNQLTPLCLAVRKGHLEIVEPLLQRLEIDVNRPSEPQLCPLYSHLTHSPLHSAVIAAFDENVQKENGYAIIKLLLNHKDISPNNKDKDDLTPLHLAIERAVSVQDGLIRKHSTIEIGRIVEILLQSPQVDCNAKRYHGITPLHRAIDLRQEGIVKLLLERKDIIIELQDDEGRTPLHLAAQRGDVGIVQALIKAGADKYKLTKKHITPLHLAIMGGHEKVAESLVTTSSIDQTLVHEARIYKAATLGDNATMESLLSSDIHRCDLKRPFQIALANGHVKIANLLLERAQVNVNEPVSCLGPVEKGITWLHHAAAIEDMNVITMLLKIPGINLNVKDADRWTPLHFAAQEGHCKAVQALLAKGADKHARDKKEMTPLYIAALNNHENVASLLIDDQAINGPIDNKLKTLLHLASYRNHINVARLLLRRGAKVYAQTSDGLTPLHLAASEGHEQIVQELLQADKKGIDTADYKGMTPLHLAVQYKHPIIVESLVKAGANMLTRTTHLETPLDLLSSLIKREGLTDALQNIKRLLKLKRENISQSYSKIIPQKSKIEKNALWTLHEAASAGDLSRVKELLHKGYDVNDLDEKGYTPLRCAINAGNDTMIKFLLNHPNIDVNLPSSKDGWTPLHCAVEKGHIALVNFLLELHVNINAVDVNGFTPLHLTILYKRVEIAQLLLKAQADVTITGKNGETPLDQALEFDLPVSLIHHLILRGSHISKKNRKILRERFANDPATILNSSNKPAQAYQSHPSTNQQRPSTLASQLPSPQSLPAQSISYALDNELLEMVQVENSEKIKQLLAQGANINAQDMNGLTPIHIAVLNGNFPLVKLLCSYPALDVNIPEKRHRATPLHFAIQRGSRPMINELLQSATIDVNRESELGTALRLAHEKGYYDILPLLLTHGAQFNRRDSTLVDSIRLTLGTYPLLLATVFGQPEGVDLFKDCNEELCEETMLLAIAQEQLEVIELLMVLSDTFIGKELLHEMFIQHAQLMMQRYANRKNNYRYIFDFLSRNLVIEEKKHNSLVIPSPAITALCLNDLWRNGKKVWFDCLDRDLITELKQFILNAQHR